MSAVHYSRQEPSAHFVADLEAINSILQITKPFDSQIIPEVDIAVIESPVPVTVNDKPWFGLSTYDTSCNTIVLNMAKVEPTKYLTARHYAGNQLLGRQVGAISLLRSGSLPSASLHERSTADFAFDLLLLKAVEAEAHPPLGLPLRDEIMQDKSKLSILWKYSQARKQQKRELNAFIDNWLSFPLEGSKAKTPLSLLNLTEAGRIKSDIEATLPVPNRNWFSGD